MLTVLMTRMKKSYSYGMVLTDGVNVIETDSKRFFEAEDASMRNVAGEIMGSKVAIKKSFRAWI